MSGGGEDAIVDGKNIAKDAVGARAKRKGAVSSAVHVAVASFQP